MKQQETHIDYILLLILFALFIFSLVTVYSGSGQYQTSDPFYFVKRQIIWYAISIAIMIAVITFDYELIERWAIFLYAVGVGLLILVHFFGTFKNGSQRWLSLGAFDLQPSEFMKIFLIIFLAYLINKTGNRRLSFRESIPITIKTIFFTSIPFLFILVQPDLGSALVIGAIAFALLFISGVSYKIILLLCASMTGLLVFLIYLHNHFFEIFIKIIKPHQLNRIYGWLSPGEYASSHGYQLTQAMLGIGSGQMKGAGFTQGSQVQNGRVPEAHTDFIFAVIGEEFGFIGASILVCLYFLLIYRMTLIALNSNTLLGVYICVGSIALIAFQAFQNISMTIGLLPITGLTLPFISYGGSALLTNFIAIGFVLSVNIRSKKYMFNHFNDELKV